MVSAPKRGDILLIDLRPGMGSEQLGGPRPCVVVSGSEYNAHSDVVTICPMTRQRKGWPFEVPSAYCGIDGAVLVDHVRTIDRIARGARIIGTLDSATMEHVLAKLQALLFQ